MRMNAGIIMAGQNPDFAQSYGQGYQLGRQNAFKTLAEQYGAKAMEGDKEALNAFAAFDPQMGMGLAASRQNMDVQSERLQMARAEAARAAERHAMTMDATERKMQAEKIGRGLATVVPAIQSGNLEAVNQQLRTFGMDPVGSIDDARLLVAQYDGAYEAFTRLDAMKPKAVEPEYEYRNGQYIQLNAPGGPRPVDVPGLNPEPQDAPNEVQLYEYYAQQERAMGREPMPYGEWRIAGDKARAGDQGKPLGTDGAILVPDPNSASGYRIEYAANSEAARKISQGETANANRAENEAAGAVNVLGVVQDLKREIEANPTMTTGFVGSLVRGLPGTSAYNAEATAQTIKANLAFDALAAMRKASPTGGALGAVSERELALLESQIANLDMNQSTDRVLASLESIEQQYMRLLKKAYETGDPAALDAALGGRPSFLTEGEAQIDGYTIREVE